MTQQARFFAMCVFVGLICLSANVGCRFVATPFALWGKAPTKTIQAEYPFMDNQRVLILVWADGETRFMYPQVQLEVAEHIREALENNPNLENVTCVPVRRVVQMQRSEPFWHDKHASEHGRRFKADKVLFIEISEYGTREPHAEHLYRGHITANIEVYDVSEGDEYGPVWTPKDGPIRTIFPEDGPGHHGVTDTLIRRHMMEQFAIEVAGMFYDRTVQE